jgi:hypothetical protein
MSYYSTQETINCFLAKCSHWCKVSWRKTGFRPAPLFASGVLDLSPAWFQAAHEVSPIYCFFCRNYFNNSFQRLQDELYVSSDLKSNDAAKFLAATPIQSVCNAITSVISPTLYSAGLSSISKVQHGSVLANHHPVVDRWMSAWSGCSLIVNRTTPKHRDWGAAASAYDLLVSAGTHTNCSLHLPDIGAKLRYLPGTAVAYLAGFYVMRSLIGLEGRGFVALTL